MDGLTLLALILFLFLSFLCFLIYVIQKRPSSPNKRSDDSPPPKIGFSAIVRNGHRFLEWTAELVLASRTNTIVLPSGGVMIITGNPKNVEHFLKARFGNYPKGEGHTSVLEDFLGGGIFNSDGDHWRVQRKIASLEFNTKTIRTFVLGNVHREVTGRLLPALERAAAAGEAVDLQDALDRLAFDNVCQVAFDVDPARLAGDTEEAGRFAHAFEAATGISVRRFRQPRLLWQLRRALNIGDERQLKAELAAVNEFAMRVVRERKGRTREEIKHGDDLLSRFIAEGDFSDEFLRDVVISFVLAGRDTTSSAMAWFFWLVSGRPEVQRRILDEIGGVRERHGNRSEALSLGELREMEYLHAAVSETLRLYPPVPLEPRTCAADDELPDGTKVRKGWSVTYNTYAMGRMESIWGEDCREYRPERWLDQNGVFQPKSPFKFPVFHAGPRTCLGKEMAYTQMKAVVASVLERFEIEVADKEREREIDFLIALRMKGGLPVRVKPREGKCADGISA